MGRRLDDYWFKTCFIRSRALEYGEKCDCGQPVKSVPRDGLRAKCPVFEHRSSYRGVNYIACAGKKGRFQSCDARNAHYRDYCCAGYTDCAEYRKRIRMNEGKD